MNKCGSGEEAIEDPKRTPSTPGSADKFSPNDSYRLIDDKNAAGEPFRQVAIEPL